MVAFSTLRDLFAFVFWCFNRPKSPRLVASQPLALSLLSVFGVSPAPNSSSLVAFPTPALICFRFLGFYQPQTTQVGCTPNPPLFLRFRFLGFYPFQIPPGCLPSQSRALSGLSVFGVLPAPISRRLVAFPTPRALWPFGFRGFTHPKFPPVGCLPNPPRFVCFRFLGFYPPQIPLVWLRPSPLPPPRLVAFPTHRTFLLSVFGVLPAPKSPRLVAFPTPLLCLLLVF